MFINLLKIWNSKYYKQLSIEGLLEPMYLDISLNRYNYKDIIIGGIELIL